MNLLCRM